MADWSDAHLSEMRLRGENANPQEEAARLATARAVILQTVKSTALTHEQKVATLAHQATDLLEVLDKTPELRELLEQPIDKQCICDLNEGHAPLCPRYIIPDYARLMRDGCQFLRLAPPRDLYEAIDTLLVFYKHVPSVTNYPVFVGQLDELLEPFVDTVDEPTAKKLIRLFLRHIDRTVLDSFAHANIGPRASRVGYMILEACADLQDAVPNLTLKYDPNVTDDDFARACVQCALRCAKPSFANHCIYKKEWGEEYAVASCYNALPVRGGSFTLSRLILGNIAKKARNTADFLENILPQSMRVMRDYMNERIRFIAQESGFFAPSGNFLVREGFVERERFTAMFALVGLAEAVNNLEQGEPEGAGRRFGHDAHANALGARIVKDIYDFTQQQTANPYCTDIIGGHFALHAQVGLAEDVGVSPGVRIPIGEEPENLADHLRVLAKLHKYFPAGVGDIFPLDTTVERNPDYVLDIVKGAFSADLRYLSFFGADSDVVRITGYLAKRSDMEKLAQGQAVMHDTTALGLGASQNGHALDRRRI